MFLLEGKAVKTKIAIIISTLAAALLATLIASACVLSHPNHWQDGKDGASAFEIWLAAGNEGTYEDFLEWLTRPSLSQTYTLSFANTNHQTVTAPKHTLIWQPSIPTQIDICFLGWYLDSDLTQKASFPFMLEGNTTLFARWHSQHGYDLFIMDGTTITALSALGKQQSAILIPASVTVIASNAFENAPTQAIAFQGASQLHTIGQEAFINASYLQSIHLPNGLQTIGIRAFTATQSLSSITIPASTASIGHSAFLGATGLVNIIFDKEIALTRISDNTFNGAASLKTITIPKSVTNIGTNAFWGAASLASIYFEEGSQLQGIGYGAFGLATSLVSICIPYGALAIGGSAFSDAISLERIALPPTIQFIGGSAFSQATSITSIIIPYSLIWMNTHVFSGWTSEQTIYVEGRSYVPYGYWHRHWNSGSEARVVWGAA